MFTIIHRNIIKACNIHMYFDFQIFESTFSLVNLTLSYVTHRDSGMEIKRILAKLFYK